MLRGWKMCVELKADSLSPFLYFLEITGTLLRSSSKPLLLCNSRAVEGARREATDKHMGLRGEQ